MVWIWDLQILRQLTRPYSDVRDHKADANACDGDGGDVEQTWTHGVRGNVATDGRERCDNTGTKRESRNLLGYCVFQPENCPSLFLYSFIYFCFFVVVERRFKRLNDQAVGSVSSMEPCTQQTFPLRDHDGALWTVPHGTTSWWGTSV